MDAPNYQPLFLKLFKFHFKLQNLEADAQDQSVIVLTDRHRQVSYGTRFYRTNFAYVFVFKLVAMAMLQLVP